MTTLEDQIINVEKQIEAVAKQIEEVETKIKAVEGETLKGELSERERILHKEKSDLREKESDLREKERLLLQAKYQGGNQQQQQQQEKLEEVSDENARNATLTEDNLPLIYAKVARKSQENPDEINKLLQNIDDLHNLSVPYDLPVPFVCIFDSSGTGKTQLAATTAVLRPESKVLYLYAGLSTAEVAQEFYRPHWKLWGQLKPLLLDFCSSGLNPTGGSGLPGAGDMLLAGSEHPLNSSFGKILLGRSEPMTTGKLSERIRASSSKFYVFVDEVPPMKDNQNFLALALRNFLRAIGIVPILMSTHSGSHHAIASGCDSRTAGDTVKPWCRVMTVLPASCAETSGYLMKTERPLVAQIVLKLSETEQRDLGTCVWAIREHLLTTKVSAWRKSAVFQLCQLLRSTANPRNRTFCSHRLVGEHFGHFELPYETVIDLKRTDPNLEGKVRMPEAEREPLLFLALTCWRTGDLTLGKFPLQALDGSAISVRKAFEMNQASFTSSAFIANPEAMKKEGDQLEVLALASMTLASLCSDDGLLSGVLMIKFIAIVFSLMLVDGENLLSSFQKRKEALDSFVAKYPNTPHTGVRVPPAPSADSEFPNQLVEGREGMFKGRLKRPPNAERRDGALDDSSGKTLIQVECKNYDGGLDTKTLQNVIERMRVGVKVTLLFTSKLNGVWMDNIRMDEFWENNMGVAEGEMCLLYLAKEQEPSWVKTSTGKILAPGTDCKYLLVILGVDSVEAL